jgi:long-chain fatty acid transport protein
LFVPFGGRARWSQNQRFVGDPNFPLAADGVQRWSGIDGALTFIYVPAGVAYRFGRLSVGVAGNLIRSSISTTQAKNPLGGGDPDVTHEGRATLDVSGWQGSFALGAMLEAVRERLWLGLSYQAQPGLGPMAMDGTLRTDYQGGSTTVPVTLHQALPDIVRLGARLRASPVLELRLWGAYTRWSVMQTQCVGLAGGDCAVDTTGADATANGNTIQNLRRRWHDTVAVHTGASRWVGPRTELFAGATFETAAIPDETLDPGLPDANNILATLGARMALRPRLHAALSYAHIQYWNRDNTGRSQLLDAQPPTRRADGGGRYTQWVGLVDLNVDVEF